MTTMTRLLTLETAEQALKAIHERVERCNQFGPVSCELAAEIAQIVTAATGWESSILDTEIEAEREKIRKHREVIEECERKIELLAANTLAEAHAAGATEEVVDE